MKTIIGFIFIATLAVTRADEAQDKGDLIRDVADYADTLKELLEENWTVEAKGREITLISKFEVFYIALVSRSSLPPEFSDKTPRELLKEESAPEKYVIRLRFEPSMPREEFERKRNERQKLADGLNNGAPSKDEYSLARRQYDEIKIPTYSDSYDVYQEVSANLGVYPPKSVQKVGGAKEILAVVLRKVLTAHD